MKVFDYYVYEEGLETIEVEVLPVPCFQLYQHIFSIVQFYM
jgi:hypothetical protein